MRLERLADLLNEVGMLKNTPRSGFAFLGSGEENVAEHSFRTSIIGYILARLAEIDPAKVVMLCLFHDVHEARTGDMNYVNYRYNTADEKAALRDAFEGTGLEREAMEFWNEFNEKSTPEAMLAKDADQLDLLCTLQMELSKGNDSAREWIESLLARLLTPEGGELAEAILSTDPNGWWRHGVKKSWWVRHHDE